MKSNNGILIFNNGFIDIGLVSAMLEAEDCTVYVTSLPLEAMHILRNHNIDVILASSRLDRMEGQEFKELVEKIKPGVSIFLLPPALCPLDGKSSPNSYECTINMKEFVRFIQNHIRNERTLLEESAQFKEFFFSFTDRLLQIFEVNDRYFFNNDHLVAELSRAIAEKMQLEEQLVDAIHLAALLRDLGKVSIQQAILNDSSRLENRAFNQIKSHPLNTVQILKHIRFPWNMELIVRHHHEQYDGSGYPDGLKGRNIPLGSRIIAIADSYVAMTTDRPYRQAKTVEAASKEIMRMAGSQFDPEVVEVFFSVLQENATRPVRTTVLVLERDEATAAFIKLFLHGDEFELVLVGTIDEAVSSLEKALPALLIADETVLREDDLAFYTALREQQTVPVILLVEPERIVWHQVDDMLEVVGKPVDMEDLLPKIKSFVRRQPPKVRVSQLTEEVHGVSGSLEDMGVPDIIQVLHLGMKTAKVILLQGSKRGHIFLKMGTIVHSECGDQVGSDAFFELVGWAAGKFCIFHGQTTDAVSVTTATMPLLLEATRLLDEKRRDAEEFAGT